LALAMGIAVAAGNAPAAASEVMIDERFMTDLLSVRTNQAVMSGQTVSALAVCIPC
jgi:hypothetical protein